MIYVYRNNPDKIQNYHILGERHSGTKFLDKTINNILKLNRSTEYGHKHFFGFFDYEKLKQDNSTLFLGIVRNPYDWIAAMNKEPHHVPENLTPILNHLEDEFYSVDQYTKPYEDRIYTSGYRQEILEDRNIFNIGFRYKNILELRNTKRHYMYKIFPNYSNSYILTTYEFLVNNLTEYISIISNLFKLNTQTKALESLLPKKYKLDKKYKTIINKNLNWNEENMLGYKVSWD